MFLLSFFTMETPEASSHHSCPEIRIFKEVNQDEWVRGGEGVLLTSGDLITGRGVDDTWLR